MISDMLATEPLTMKETQSPLIGAAPPSPAGPVDESELDRLSQPPTIPLPRWLQVLRFNQRRFRDELFAYLDTVLVPAGPAVRRAA